METSIVPEVWIDVVPKFEELGGGVCRFYLCKIKKPLDGIGPIEYEVALTVLASLSRNASIITLLRTLADDVCDLAMGLMTH